MSYESKVFSPSQINTYRTCPKKYYFQYVKKIPIETKSPWLEIGSKVHSQISKHDFESKDLMIRMMLRNAQKFLNNMPRDPIMETTYEDKDNPGRFYGDVLGRRFVGIFDYHWPDKQMAGDWKTGKLNLRYTDSYEIQAYILNELYKQKYDKYLEKFYFNFIKLDKIYTPQCIKDGSNINLMIEEALRGIEAREFERNLGILCNYCDYAKICKGEDLPEKTPESKGTYDCTTCRFNRRFVIIGGKQKVQCQQDGVRDIPDGCCGWHE
jgi:hypothetical protein